MKNHPARWRFPRCSPLALALILLSAALASSTAIAAAPQTRPFEIDDIFSIKSVSDPRVSPDGAWVAYTVSQMDRAKDSSDTDIWMAPTTGGEAVRLTTSDESESSPRWSPDGRWLAFLSGRDGDRSQVWLLPRIGGEAWRLTDFEAGVSGMEWSPDSTRLALLIRDPEEKEEEEEGEEDDEAPGSGGAAASEAPRAPKPIVVTRLQFKRDGAGYLDERRTHVYIFDVESKESFQLTDGPYDDSSPVWAPSGDSLAFVSNRTDEPDANDNSDVFLVDAEEGSEPRQLTATPGADSSPRFTPDGRHLVYVQGGDPKDVWYDTNDVALIPVEGGEPRVLTEGLDRNVSRPTVTADGSTVAFLLENYGTRHVAGVPLSGGDIERIVAGERAVSTFDLGPADELVVLESQTDHPAEISRVVGDAAARNATLTRITHVNDEFLAGIDLAPVTVHEAPGTDGVTIQYFLTLPPGSVRETGPLPTLLRIHGGPVSQFSHSFSSEWQIFAAQGYAVVAANPRGSSGRGRDFSRAIFADWGTVDFEDVMAAVDDAIAGGVADPDRLGVGGWSYGGILTNYVITKTGRFKGAISGASEVNYTANYGHDHYQLEWERELGLPWENTDLWIRISPFFHVENVTTPTLVMCGQQDWNVPLQNSDQLYQALRRLGVPSELVVYPGQSHGIRLPSYQVDRYERYLAWYDKWVKGIEPSDGPAETGSSSNPMPQQEQNWPGFLGPVGVPVGDDPNLPVTWSRTENVEWAADIPGAGWSSPVVWGNRVFVTGATSDQPMKQPSYGVDFSNEYIAELQDQGLSMEEVLAKSDERDAEFSDEVVVSLMLYSLDLDSGEILWERQLRHGNPAVGRHRKNSYMSETPVTDGEAIYVYVAHTGLFAYDFEGNQLWATPLEAYKVYFEFGGGASPALHENRIYILNDNEEASFVAAFDKHTGRQIWRTARPGLGRQRSSAFSSPIVWENDLRTEIVTQGPLTSISYDLDGNELWRMSNMGLMPIPTPIVWDGLLYLVSGPPGGRSRPIAAVRPGASGDITLTGDATSSEHVVWYDWRGAPYLSTPVIYDGALYVLQDKGILTKYDAKTGAVIYRSRIATGAAHFTASPWAHNGKIFCLSEEGDTYVIGTGDEYELLGVNSLDEFSMATPAMVGDRLLLRTQQHLWSIRR